MNIMKNKYLIFLLLLTAFSVSSCIQDEAPNAECDILSVDTTNIWFQNNKDILTGDFKVNNRDIVFIVKKETDFNSIVINCDSIIDAFTLTPGARIEGNNIESDNNGIYLYFTTHSEDGKWNKTYTIKFIKIPALDIDHVFNFENHETGSFTSWYEINNDGIRSDIWSSGNAGFKIVASKKPAEEYPTTTYKDGFSGACIKLTTCDTGTMGKLSKMPYVVIIVNKLNNSIKKNELLEEIEFIKINLL